MNNPPTVAASQQIPAIEISKVLGLLEVLKSSGGQQDIYKLAAELKMELGELLLVLRAAELLGLLHTPGGDVILMAPGQKILRSRIKEKKSIIRAQMELIPIFKDFCDFIRSHETGEVSREASLHKLAELIPDESPETSFNNLISWGRYAELIGYNDDTSTVYLGEASKN